MQLAVKTISFYGIAVGTMVTIVTICCVHDGVRDISVRYLKSCSTRMPAMNIRATTDSSRHRLVTTEPSEPEVTSEIFLKRRLHLQKYCQNQNIGHVGRLANHIGYKGEEGVASQLLYDKRHGLVYCTVPKVGSSFWKRVVRIIKGRSVAHSPFEMYSVHVHLADDTMTRYGRQELRDALTGSTTVMFVRHPLGRLFSAYMDKLFLPTFQDNSWFYLQTRRLGQNIVSLVRSRASAVSRHCGHDVTFAETVFYVILTLTRQRDIQDPHFVPAFRHCRPCSVSYDYIGKMETFERDTRFILERLNLTSMLGELEKFKEGSDVNILMDLARRTFSVLEEHAQCYSRHEIFLRLWRTYHVRGLLSDDKEFPLTPEESDRITLRDFQRVIKKAYATSKPRDERIIQRKRAVTHAYKSVPAWHFRRLQKIYQRDCDMFDYDCSMNGISM